MIFLLYMLFFKVKVNVTEYLIERNRITLRLVCYNVDKSVSCTASPTNSSHEMYAYNVVSDSHYGRSLQNKSDNECLPQF